MSSKSGPSGGVGEQEETISGQGVPKGKSAQTSGKNGQGTPRPDASTGTVEAVPVQEKSGENVAPGTEKSPQGQKYKPLPVGKEFSSMVKVVQCDSGDSTQKGLATIQATSLLDAPLSELRTSHPQIFTPNHSFIFPDGSPADEELPLGEYFDYINESSTVEKPESNATDKKDGAAAEPTKSKAERKIYLQGPAAAEKTASSVLAQTHFVMNVLEWTDGSGSGSDEAAAGPSLESRATIQSKTLNVQDWNIQTLTMLRRTLSKLTPMSVNSNVNKFCTSKGIPVTDETLLFSDYLKLESNKVAENPELASVTVVYKAKSKSSFGTKVEMDKLPGAYEPIKLKENAFEGMKEAKEFSSHERDFEAEVGKAGELESRSAADLSEKEWPLVMNQCGLLYGWVVDRARNEIVRATRPAFQLRERDIGDPYAKIPDYLQAVSEDTVKQTEVQAAEAKKLLTEDGKQVASSDSSATDKSTASATESDDSETTIRCKIPKYLVNDDSRIEVTMVSHEFERSMATNDFSSQSVEGSMSGGFAGFTATVSAGYAQSKSTSDVNTSNTFTKTMIAKYLFPRVDIMLNPEDVEPSEELKVALARVAKTKNVNDLRAIHRDFGQLFCRKVTLGGRLQSTKIMTDTSKSKEHEQKEQFKVSMGLQVSTPFGGGGVKAESEKGHMQSTKETEIDKKENHVFEAVGGETLLASNPDLWVASVGRFENWRVIKRDSLSTLVDMLAAIPGYSGVKRLFLQAVPTLSQYLQVDSDKELTVRFRLSSPTSQLSLSYLKRQISRDLANKEVKALENNKNAPPPDTTGAAVYYLGHHPLQVISPRLTGIDQDRFWHPVPPHEPALPLFTPRQYRAPAIMGYAADRPDISSHYTQDFTDTVWSITAPFDETLQHGSKVIVRTKPAEVAPKPIDPNNPNAIQPNTAVAASMVVFRNAQGVFLPAMSGVDDVHYWRIIKVGARRVGENIKEGDQIRLCWVFQDQTLGFRDFKDDVFGRRRAQMPEDMTNSALWFKLPWPRFESLMAPKQGEKAVPNAMVMSAQPTQDIAFEALNTLPSIDSGHPGLYGLQDVSFYIDAVSNKGQGDTDDYLLKGLAQAEGQTDKQAWVEANSKESAMVAKQKIIYEMFFLECEKA